MTTTEFWQNLDFNEVRTFSICRNETWKKHRESVIQIYIDFSRLQQSGDWLAHDFLSRRRINELLFMQRRSEDWVGSPPHIDEQGNLLHPFGNLVATLLSNSDEVKELGTIMQTEFVYNTDWMCLPVYREGILFYKDKKFIACLDVCLGCSALAFNGKRLDTDMTVYEKLGNWFRSLGHQIISNEEDEWAFIGTYIKNVLRK
jgi:hypothetical protein